MYQFQKAVSIWCDSLKNEYNQFVGFYTEIQVSENNNIKLAIAARSYYRLYINGSMRASGPARTASQYSRVDEIEVDARGKLKIAIEVVALNKPERYSNDCTLESGMLTAEITDQEGNLLSATGESEWKCMELSYRRSLVETMSHSRGIIEVYDLNPHSFQWLTQEQEEMKTPVRATSSVTYLKRRAPYATYDVIPMGFLTHLNDVIPGHYEDTEENIILAKMFNPKWYDMIPKENQFLEVISKEQNCPFTGTFQCLQNKRGRKTEIICPGKHPAALTWSLPKSELGFIDLTLEMEKDGILDIVNSDYMEPNGMVKANTYVTRYYLKKGQYHLTTFEPKLVRYIKLIFRTQGEIRVDNLCLLEYTYPDDNNCFFQCNDGELNMIYEAARRTLRLNTLDIFMDCPQRERGGWLCDSQFASHGAWQMFGDLSVEKDFIENFMLTDPDVMWHSFFPEVYPGCKTDSSDPGISNWSFWLLTELADYYNRSGDKEFILKCQERVCRFVEGLLTLRGESGLLEGLKNQFVDWSLSNRSFCTEPISIPINCLAVCLLEKMAELYYEPEWKKAANEMRQIIQKMDESPGIFGGGGDGASYETGELKRLNCATESGVALELWSGFHLNDKAYLKRFTDAMGTCPAKRPDPNFGRSNLFIGLLIRFDVLARLGKINTLVRELKDVFLPEIKEGPGTLFENYAGSSGCHGFNGAVGALLVNHVLGLGQPMQRTKSVKINPNPGTLNWAAGSAKCEDGMIFMNWSADGEGHILKITLHLPKGWVPEFEIPFELTGWTILVNDELLDKRYK